MIYVADEIQVSKQALGLGERPQMHFEGDPLFEPSSFSKTWDLVMREAVREMSSAPPILSFEVGNEFIIPMYAGPRYAAQKLFDDAPQCEAYWGGDGLTLDCHLDAGHSGAHYDGFYRMEWLAR